MSLRSITLASIFILASFLISCKSIKHYGSPLILKNVIMSNKLWEKFESSYSLENKKDLPKLIKVYGVRNNSLELKRLVLLVAELNDTMERTIDSAILLSRSSFLVADCSTNKKDILRYSQKAIDSFNGMDWEKNPEAAYYYALGLGAVIRIEGLSAIVKLPGVIAAMKAALKKPETDYYGPHRIYGMLYLKAPKWPKGIGDVDEALKHLKISMNNSPDFPQNPIFYGEALIEDDQMDDAKKYLSRAQRSLQKKNWGTYYNNLWKKEIKNNIKKAVD